MDDLQTLLIVAGVSFAFGAGLVSFWLFGVVRKWRKLSKYDSELQQRESRLRSRGDELDNEAARQRLDWEEFHKRVASQERLQTENTLLKRDLRNIGVSLSKVERDEEKRELRQQETEKRVDQLAQKYLSDVEKWVGKSLTANNYEKSKSRLTQVIEWCRGVGFDVPQEREEQLLDDLKADFKKVVRAQLEKEEQARIKAQIREEQAREREIAKELKAAEREREVIEAALAKALESAADEHSAEIEALRSRLAEAEERGKRAVSQAQLTRSGHIYVISNVGSFGEEVYKIGMTRRLDPMDRVKELGDASVPFTFDVHMMIASDDAPTLESALHKRFRDNRVNRVNMRKEFFRVALDEIAAAVQAEHGQIEYTADAEALEYRQSVEMTSEDAELVEAAFADASKDLGIEFDDD